MATRFASEYGNHTDVSRFGDILKARDGNGDTYGEAPFAVWTSEIFPITPEEVETLARARAQIDVKMGNITFPPDPEVAIQLATEFYDVYLCDTGENRVEMTDRYVAMLIEELENGEKTKSFEAEEDVEQYVHTAHQQAEELLAAA